MDNDKYIARAVKNDDGTWSSQSLADHLNGTARLAGEFAAAFGNRDWGECLGWWHDLGKFHPVWQQYIRRQTGFDEDAVNETVKGKINHSTAGAVQAMLRQHNSPPARILAYILAGHHAGLPDWDPDEAGGDLCNRIYRNGQIDRQELDEIVKIQVADQFLQSPLPKTFPMGLDTPQTVMSANENFHLWIRMLFSCLVDADYLDTEYFLNPKKADHRGAYLTLGELKERFDSFIATKEKSAKDTPLNRQRKSIREQCINKAAFSSGFFSLTVPTGGGKTLSSMAFALEHAHICAKKRIIYVIPYTSIIEQTAKVFKYGTDIEAEIHKGIENGNVLFGEDQVVEHHSQVVYGDDDNRFKLATENWDAPLIVTTNVQLFESLFAARSSSCRKLHNLANSIIILDEVQMLPPDYLKPLLSLLQGLVKYFNVTIVLMTATQPTLEGRIATPPNEFQGLQNVRAIFDAPDQLMQSFDRVDFSFPSDLHEPQTWETVRDNLVQYDQVLCIVNTRKDCHDLYSMMPKDTIHLSALMCPEERSHVISNIKEKLNRGESMRVVSTQLVEAGVDIDFPVVYRALAGFDSIAQAAGRCNRENRLAEKGMKGKTVVFIPPRSAPPGLLRKGEDACKEVLRTHDIRSLSTDVFADYFKWFYARLNSVDKPRFHDRLVRDAADFKFQFRTYAGHFHLIDDQCTQSIVVRYRDSNQFITMLRTRGKERWLSRKLQRYMVNIPARWLKHFVDHDMLETVAGYWVQKGDSLYKEGTGVQLDDAVIVEQLIV